MNKLLIEDTLVNIGMPTNIKGFTYIVSIVTLLDQPEWTFPKWSALYYCVGQLYNTTPASVEKAIRHALKTTRDRNSNYSAINKYIGFDNCENSNSLMLLYTKLKQEERHSNTIVTKFMLKEALLDIIHV